MQEFLFFISSRSADWPGTSWLQTVSLSSLVRRRLSATPYAEAPKPMTKEGRAVPDEIGDRG